MQNSIGIDSIVLAREVSIASRAAAVFCSGATVTKGWDETLARYRRRYQSEGREMGRLRFDGIEVVALGPDAALARGAWRLHMTDGKEPHGLFTLVLRRLDGSWRIVHDHTSSGE